MSIKVRCAIYTRKSTDEGLEQDFNSLHAQREACEAFIKSQKQEGWRALPDTFDDGGYSGGNIERPALVRLLDMVRSAKIDVIVVYKVDRLTRSLADFAKMIELFDAHDASFVSVTQQFNTTSSMGRLTLNVLLSFAQFEREVTAERIRDKIAASKKKGMWMGGLAPLGYDVRDKKLVVNPDETRTVQLLFRRYLELGTVKKLLDESNRLGLVTKRRQRPGGGETGGQPFTRGHLYQLLANPIYAGDVTHKGVPYPGQHDAVIDRNTFDAVQRQLTGNATARHSSTNAKAPSLLAGLVFDDSGDRLCPTHANKKGRRYRYYISKRLIHHADSTGDGWRIPAKELENTIIQAVCDFLKDGLRVVDALGLSRAGPDIVSVVLNSASESVEAIHHGTSEQQKHHLRCLIQRASVHPDLLHIELRVRDLHRFLLGQYPGDDALAETVIALETPVRLTRRGVETKLIVPSTSASTVNPDAGLIRLIAQAHLWLDDLINGKAGSVRDIARHYGLDEGDVSRVIPLAFLAPDIVEAILAGKHPISLTTQKLKRVCTLPPAWEDQRQSLGFLS